MIPEPEPIARARARDRGGRARADREAGAGRSAQAGREAGAGRGAAARAAAARARADREAGAARARSRGRRRPRCTSRAPRSRLPPPPPVSGAARRGAAAARAGRPACAAEAGDRDRRRVGACRARRATPRASEPPRLALRPAAARRCETAPGAELRSRRARGAESCRTNPRRPSRPCAAASAAPAAARASARSVARPPASLALPALSAGAPVRDPGAEPTPSRVAARDPAPANAASRSRSNEPKLRGVALGSLASCVSDREEDALKQQLVALVGEPAECVSAAGRYRFVETRNLNAFLLWVERAPARPEADRCVELTHALDCVRKHGGRGVAPGMKHSIAWISLLATLVAGRASGQTAHAASANGLSASGESQAVGPELTPAAPAEAETDAWAGYLDFAYVYSSAEPEALAARLQRLRPRDAHVARGLRHAPARAGRGGGRRRRRGAGAPSRDRAPAPVSGVGRRRTRSKPA